VKLEPRGISVFDDNEDRQGEYKVSEMRCFRYSPDICTKYMMHQAHNSTILLTHSLSTLPLSNTFTSFPSIRFINSNIVIKFTPPHNNISSPINSLSSFNL
jgi:hypothetical protein